MFTMRASKSEFVKFVGGHADIFSDKWGLTASITGASKSEILKKVSKLCGLASNESTWICRRYYGSAKKPLRDVSYMNFDLNRIDKACLLLKYREEKTAQLDSKDNVRSTSMGKILVRFPRHTSSVKTCKRRARAHA